MPAAVYLLPREGDQAVAFGYQTEGLRPQSWGGMYCTAVLYSCMPLCTELRSERSATAALSAVTRHSAVQLEPALDAGDAVRICYGADGRVWLLRAHATSLATLIVTTT